MSNPRTIRPLPPEALTPDIMVKFWSRTQPGENGCVIWTGTMDKSGYGHFAFSGDYRLSHRVAWVAANGRDVPVGHELDHLCRTRACVNPRHLEAVTPQENSRRGSGQTAATMATLHDGGTCARGHDLTLPDAWRVHKRGTRYCRQCQMEKNREGSRRRAQQARVLKSLPER